MDSPYTQYRPAQYRGPSTSDDPNARVEEYYKDLIVLVNRARLSEVGEDEFFRRFAKMLYDMDRKLMGLEERVGTLEDGKKRLTFFSSSQLDNDRFNSTAYNVPSATRLSVDERHGVITLPLVEASSMSKLRYTNSDGDEMISPSVEMRVLPKTGTADDGAGVVDTSPPELAILRRAGHIWERNIIVNASNANGAELTLYVRVPTDLFTTAMSNAILLHPFPAFGISVKDVAYTTNVSPALDDADGYTTLNSAGNHAGTTEAIGWIAPGGWTSTYAGQDAAVDAGPRIYYFPPAEVTAIRIKISQDDYYKEGTKYIYSYGLEQLDLRYNKFQTTGKAIFLFEAPAGTIDTVSSVQPEIWNLPSADWDAAFNHRVIWETAPNSGTYTLTPVANSNRVWIEVELNEVNGITPSLSGIQVTYTN